jgi:type II secretory pathway pseudopilin PulG
MGISDCGLRIADVSRRHGDGRGMIYPMLLVSIMVLGIATAGVSQIWSTQVKRDKESELLFRLREYRRAIQQYRTDHNRLPKELSDLLMDRSQLQVRRYLRRLYTDPMTGKPDWQLKQQVDRTGTTSGILGVNSRSTDKPLRQIDGKQADAYRDW